MSTSTLHFGFRGSELRRIAIPMVIAAAATLAVSIGAAAGPIQAIMPGTSRCVPGTGAACSLPVHHQLVFTAPAPLGRPVIISQPQATSPLSAADKANVAALRARFQASMGLSTH